MLCRKVYTAVILACRPETVRSEALTAAHPVVIQRSLWYLGLADSKRFPSRKVLKGRLCTRPVFRAKVVG